MFNVHQSVRSALIALLALLAPGSANAKPPASGPPADPAIVYVDSSGSISVMNADGSNNAAVLGGAILVSHLSWSPDGGSICFFIMGTVEGTSCTGVAALDIDVVQGVPVGNNFRMLVDTGDDEIPYALPSWSPDGARIAYTQEHPMFITGIYTIPAEGGDPTPVYEAYGEVDVPSGVSWDPDGTRIAYSRFTGGGDGGFGVIDLVDGSRFDVLFPMNPGRFDWSRDGTRLLFTTNSSIYTVDAAPGAMPQFICVGGHPTWSPDDTRIAYPTGGRHRIVIRDLQSGATINTGAKGSWLDWRRYE